MPENRKKLKKKPVREAKIDIADATLYGGAFAASQSGRLRELPGGFRQGFSLFSGPGFCVEEDNMYNASDLRKGLKIEIDGTPYTITEFTFTKPGKGQALYTCRMKSLLTGQTISKTYRSVDKIDETQLEERTLTYSYQDGDHYVFMDRNYEQVSLDAATLGDRRLLLVEDTEVDVLYHNGRPIDVTLPTFVELTIEHTEAGARGNTATNVLKPATLEGGYVVQVPLFVNTGDIVKIDTRTGEYADRVRKTSG